MYVVIIYTCFYLQNKFRFGINHLTKLFQPTEVPCTMWTEVGDETFVEAS